MKPNSTQNSKAATFRLNQTFLAVFGALAIHSAAFAGTPSANTLPTGGTVTSGQATITQSGNTLTVNQTTGQGVINWNTFNIGSSATVNVNLPSANSSSLNRVMSTDGSVIMGHLNSNGQVFLINPNGVLFGQGASVNVGGLVASTLNISDANYLNGQYVFNRNGSTASVTNQDTINSHYVALLASNVDNEGVIQASMGTVALAGGEAVTLSISGQDLVSVQVDKATIDTMVKNGSLIQVDGGQVILSAQSANGMLGQVVNSGQIEANGITSNGGVISLAATSTINNTGTLSANGGTNGNGGNIKVIADLTNAASLTTIDGVLSAQGGSVSGNGGKIETSGSNLKFADSAVITAKATNGTAGTWLLDPYNFIIASSGGDITGAALTAALAGGATVTIQTTNSNVSCATTVGSISCGSGSSGAGNIYVMDSINTGMGALNMAAYGSVYMNSAITSSSMSYIGVVVGAGGHIYYGPSYSLGTNVTATQYTDNTFNGTVGPMRTTSGLYCSDGTDCFPTAYIQLTNTTNTSTYGTAPTFTWGLYDASTGGNAISNTIANNSVTWTNPITATSNANTYSEAYSGSLTGMQAGLTPNYIIAAGAAKNWIVNPETIYVTLANSTLSSSSGTAPTFTDTLSTDSAGNSPVNLTTTSGAVSWSNPITAATSAGIYSETYTGNLALSNYSFAAGVAKSWTVNTVYPSQSVYSMIRQYVGIVQAEADRVKVNGDNQESSEQDRSAIGESLIKACSSCYISDSAWNDFLNGKG